MKKVAITGGLASGKSTVCDLFRSLGAEVVSADEVVHQLLSSDPTIIHAVTELLGPTIISDGQIDRKKIANIVFNKPQLLQSLEKILHPAVRQAIEKHYRNTMLNKQTPLFVAEIPLYYESGGGRHSSFYDDYAVICVVASEDVRQNRFNSRHGKTGKDFFEERQNNQMPLEEKAQLADFVIPNNGSLEELKTEVKQLFNKLTQN